MKVSNTEELYKIRRNTKRFLTKISPARKAIVAPKLLCVSINRLPVDMKSPFTFRINTYREGIHTINEFTPQQDMEILIAEFKFITNVIRHNLKITSSNGANILMENLKDSVDRQILLNQIKVSTRAIHLNGYCDLKNLLIRILDPNSEEKFNNIKLLALVLDEIKSNPLCNDTILNALTPIYEKCVNLSTQTVDALRNDTISLDDLFDSCLVYNQVK